MKQFITVLLCASLLCLSGGWPEEQARGQAAGAALIVVCAAAAGLLIFWVYKTYDTPKIRCLVLEKSHYDGNWIPVATNIMLVPPNLARAFPAFSDKMTDETACYRVKEIPMPSNFTPQLNLSGTAQPYLYEFSSAKPH